jgi:hypothetical protein
MSQEQNYVNLSYDELLTLGNTDRKQSLLLTGRTQVLNSPVI